MLYYLILNTFDVFFPARIWPTKLNCLARICLQWFTRIHRKCRILCLLIDYFKNYEKVNLCIDYVLLTGPEKAASALPYANRMPTVKLVFSPGLFSVIKTRITVIPQITFILWEEVVSRVTAFDKCPKCCPSCYYFYLHINDHNFLRACRKCAGVL